jgi:protoporphyrinogen oxidase
MEANADRVAVLGAGPMGLGVAYQLVRDGRRPVVFEADDRVGGMAACFDFGGIRIERYYHFHCTSDVDVLRMLDELGLADRLRWVETRMGVYYQGAVHPWGNPVALLRFPGLGPIGKLRYGLHAFLSTRRTDWRPLDRLEATRWIRRWVGRQAFEVLWRPLFELKFYDYASSLSAAWIWSRIRRVGRSRYDLMREKLGYLEGGSETILEAMRRAIEAGGGEIRLKCPASKVVIADGRVAGVEAGGELHPFARVVSTVPLPYVPRLIPDLPEEILARFRAVKNIAVVCCIAKLKRPVTDKFWLNINDPGMDIPGIVEYSNLRPLDRTVVYAPFYMPGEHPKYADPDSVFTAKLKRYLMHINPDLAEDDFVEIRASRYRFAQPICEPGHLDRLPPIRLPVEGLIAADTSYYYPEDRGLSESIGLARAMARMI